MRTQADKGHNILPIVDVDVARRAWRRRFPASRSHNAAAAATADAINVIAPTPSMSK